MRATHVEPLDGWKAYNQSVDDLYWIDDPEKIITHQCDHSPSLIFGADFSPNNFNSRVAPELQVQNDLMLAQLTILSTTSLVIPRIILKPMARQSLSMGVGKLMPITHYC